jgi:hypothetical protein
MYRLEKAEKDRHTYIEKNLLKKEVLMEEMVVVAVMFT